MNLVRQKLYDTSACALIWLAGKPTSMLGNARIGSHATGWAGTGQESGLWNAVKGVYFAHLGFGYDAVKFFTAAPPNEMRWLTLEKAKQLRIAIHVYGAPPRGPSVLGY
jgi:hypothetical protein